MPPELPVLPPEIYQNIISHLARPQLAVALRVSRLFYTFGVGRLYRKVNIDLSEEVNALLYRKACNAKPKGIRYGDRLESKVTGRESSGQVGEAGLIDSIAAQSSGTSATSTTPRDELPERFTFTTHLTISSHSVPICSNIAPLEMPNLVSLKIEPTYQENDLNICHCAHSHKSGDQSNCLCPLLQHLQPRRLVLGSDTTGLTGSAAGLWRSDPTAYTFPPPWVKELVVYVGACSGIEVGPEAKHHLLDHVPSTLERLVLIMEPRRQSWASTNGRWVFRRVAGVEGRLDPMHLWRALGRVCSTKAQQVEIVGIESIDRDWTELSMKLEMAAVRMMAKASGMRRGMSEPEARAKAEAVVFTERSRYSGR